MLSIVERVTIDVVLLTYAAVQHIAYKFEGWKTPLRPPIGPAQIKKNITQWKLNKLYGNGYFHQQLNQMPPDEEYFVGKYNLVLIAWGGSQKMQGLG